MKKLEGIVKVSKVDLEAMLQDEKMSKSAKIKVLFEGGYEVKEIAALLNIRYNFAYNVIQNYVIINGIDVETVKRDTKKAAVDKLFDEGKTLVEVARELKMNYNYVWKLHKEWELELMKEVAADVAK